jgi:hypothetical protein
MGNILIALGVLAIVIYIYYEVRNKQIIKEHDGWYDWWFNWLDGEEKFGLSVLATVIFIITWAITSGITKGIVTEKYTMQKESTVMSYGGTGYETFTIGRYGNGEDGYYYVYENVDGNLKEIKLYSKWVDVQPNAFDDGNSNTATLITETTMKKIERSKMPFMFLSGKDKIKEAGGCSCSKKYTLKVPTKYIFADKFREDERRR